MYPMSGKYVLNIKDLRHASYFGFVKRSSNALRIMTIFVLAVIAYTLVMYVSNKRLDFLGLYVLTAYLIWLLYGLSKVEFGVQRCMRSGDGVLGCEHIAIFEEQRIRILVAERRINISQMIDKLACAFELSTQFLIYLDGQSVYIIPKRGFSDEEIRCIRHNFAAKLGNRFESRYYWNEK